MTQENLHAMTFDLSVYRTGLTYNMDLTEDQQSNIDAYVESLIDHIVEHGNLKHFITTGIFETIQEDIRIKLINKLDKLYKQYSL